MVLSLCGLQVEACTVKMAHFKNCEVIEGLIRDDVLVQLLTLHLLEVAMI